MRRDCPCQLALIAPTRPASARPVNASARSIAIPFCAAVPTKDSATAAPLSVSKTVEDHFREYRGKLLRRTLPRGAASRLEQLTRGLPPQYCVMPATSARILEQPNE